MNSKIIALGVLIFLSSCSPESPPPEYFKSSKKTEGTIVLTGDTFFPDYNYIYDNFQSLHGTPVEFTGFFDKTGDIPPGTIVMGREMTDCCSADTVLIGFLCRIPPELPNPQNQGAWYHIVGTLSSFLPEGYQESVPVLNVTSLKAVRKPEFDLVYAFPMGLE